MFRCLIFFLLPAVMRACLLGSQICGDAAKDLALRVRDELYILLNHTTRIEMLRKTFTDTDLITYEDLNGTKLLEDTSIELKKILQLKTDAVENIANFVREKSPRRQTDSQTRDPPSCSYLIAKDSSMKDKTNLTYYKKFNTEVDLTKTVVHFPVDVWEFSEDVKSAIHLTDGLDQVFINNYEKDRFLFGQYFGSTSGLLRYYPAFYWDTNNQTDLYDCRERPWYIEAAGQPRDVVFLMDTSGSMFGWALKVAKYTAERLLTVISDKDHVAFYSFNMSTQSVSCYTDLERARLKYRNYLIDAVKGIQANGASNFSVALEKAFDVLEGSAKLGKTCDCQRAIIIFSDYVRDDYEEIFRRRNPDRKVRVFTLAFGAPNQWDTSKLRDIACNNNGFFSTIFNYGGVVRAISSIFNVFGQPLSLNIKNIQPSWSSVYYEYDRMNFVVTVGKSVVVGYNLSVSHNIDQPFLGVAAIDVDIPQMNTIMTGMFSGIMYAFMINNNGVVVVHPRLVPIVGFGKGTPDMDINELEDTEDKNDIRRIAERMLRRDTGSERTSSLVYFPDTIRGKETFQATEYFFTSLDGFPFSIGIVVPPSERQTIRVKSDRIDKALISTSIMRDVPHTLRWKKYPLCTKNITDTIKPVVDIPQLEGDPCWPERYDTMAAEIQLTDSIARWWRSREFEQYTEENKIMDSYLITNAGITRTFRNMSDASNVMDPMDMQPFINARKGIPPNTLLVSLLNKEEGYRSFNLSYSLGIPVGSDIFEVLAVGVRVQLKILRKLLDVVFRKRDNVSITLLDESAFIVFSTDELYEETKIDKFFDKQSAVNDIVLQSKFYSMRQVKDCQQLCNEKYNEETSAQSSALFARPFSAINRFILSIWRLFVFFITSVFLDKASATHKTPKKIMCCENYTIYFRDFSKTQSYEGLAECGSCQKNITLTPVPKTNILLLIDNNPDCECPTSKTIRERYVRDICDSKLPLSQWKSDLSQQSCFDKLKSNFSTTPTNWKCFYDNIV